MAVTVNPVNQPLFNLSLDGWANKVLGLYGHHNRKRKPPEVWLSVSQFASVIAEGTRKKEFWEIKRAIAHEFCWLCAFYNQCTKVVESNSPYFLGMEFWKVIGFKFPGVDGRCRNNPCTCGLGRRAADLAEPPNMFHHELVKLRENFNGINYSVHSWSKLFVQLFANSIYRSDLETITLHLMEEVGEVARCIRKLGELKEATFIEEKKDRSIKFERWKLVEQVGDVFSFLHAISIKLSFLITGIRKRDYQKRLNVGERFLIESIIKEYGDPNNPEEIRCPRCKLNPCICEFYVET